jgi:cytidylate kinase
MAIVTISRQMGSFGNEIAKEVAYRTRYDTIDKQKISEALSGRGFPTDAIEKFDEKKPSFWQSFSYQRDRFLHLIKTVIYEFAKKDRVVIVGRGGQFLLKDLPNTLHVRVVATEELRIRRLMDRNRWDEKKAASILRRSDQDSSGYIRSFFGFDWSDETFYDLVLNTRAIPVETAVEMIVTALGARRVAEGASEARERLDDLLLTLEVEAAIMEIPGLKWDHLSVEGGVVKLDAVAYSKTSVEVCREAVLKIPGVKNLDDQIFVRPGVME